MEAFVNGVNSLLYLANVSFSPFSDSQVENRSFQVGGGDFPVLIWQCIYHSFWGNGDPPTSL